MSRGKKKRKTAGDILRYIILIIAACVFVFSAVQLGRIFLEYRAGTQEYDRIREYVQEDPQEETEQPEEGEAEDRPVPPAVDWESLKAINSDIIAWLQIEGTEISYPVVKGTDNDYYLHHTFEKNYNSAGSIFVEYTNSSDFQDCNTIIYGHNMRNGSMFGLLRKYFQTQDSLPGRYVWICTPEKDYRYEIFSSHVVDASGEVYTLFSAPDEQFQQYLDSMKAQSLVDFGVDVTKEDKIITLSTCTGNDATRFVVQARERESIKILQREKTRRGSYEEGRSG